MFYGLITKSVNVNVDSIICIIRIVFSRKLENYNNKKK